MEDSKNHYIEQYNDNMKHLKTIEHKFQKGEMKTKKNLIEEIDHYKKKINEAENTIDKLERKIDDSNSENDLIVELQKENQHLNACFSNSIHDKIRMEKEIEKLKNPHMMDEE